MLAAGNQCLQLQINIEQARVQLQDSRNAGLLAALPLEQKQAEVRQLELQGRQAELSGRVVLDRGSSRDRDPMWMDPGKILGARTWIPAVFDQSGSLVGVSRRIPAK